jgi:hypothetical protein
MVLVEASEIQKREMLIKRLSDKDLEVIFLSITLW